MLMNKIETMTSAGKDSLAPLPLDRIKFHKETVRFHCVNEFAKHNSHCQQLINEQTHKLSAIGNPSCLGDGLLLQKMADDE